MCGDLDQRTSLNRLSGLAPWVLHLAPPPGDGGGDPRTRRLIAALAKGGSLPRRLVYISTSGVYGDCNGERVAETRPSAANNPRARRRVDAERQLRRFAARHGIQLSILRAPGIYAQDRLPLDRIQKGTPAVRVRRRQLHQSYPCGRPGQDRLAGAVSWPPQSDLSRGGWRRKENGRLLRPGRRPFQPAPLSTHFPDSRRRRSCPPPCCPSSMNPADSITPDSRRS